MAKKKKTKKEVEEIKTSSATPNTTKPVVEFPLGKENYILMAVGFLSIILGFILMSGDENIYGFRKITLSVIFIMAGFIFEIYAIMKKPKD